MKIGSYNLSDETPAIMGIVNTTPDSFSDGAKYLNTSSAIRHAIGLIEDGADIIDIGGESTRPGAEEVSSHDELKRVIPVIEGIRCESDVPISIDTTKAEVAKRAIDAGANMINDISALRADADMAETIRASDGFVILMHMQGTPRTMQDHPTYDHVMEEITAFLQERITAAQEAGIAKERIWIDPGIGFGKRLEHNLEILRGIGRLSSIGSPIVIGLSRKSFLGRILDEKTADRLEGTIAANAVAVARGADVIRVHDVKEGRRTADVAYRLRYHA